MNFRVGFSIGGLFDVSLKVIFCFALLLFSFSCFSQAKATHTASFKCALESFFIRKFSDYEYFLDNLDPNEAYEKCGIQFPQFKDFDEFLRFLNLPSKFSLKPVDDNLVPQEDGSDLVVDAISNARIEENSITASFSDSNISESIQNSFSKLKAFHISIRKANKELAGEAIESLSNDAFNIIVNNALDVASAELRHDFIKGIKKECSCITDENITNSNEDCSSNVKECIDKCEKSQQNSMLLQLLMNLFIERICQLFIRTLPSNLSTLEIAVDMDISICSILLKSISHLNSLDMIDLSKDSFSFSYSNQNLILYLSQTSNCKCIKLRNLNLIRQFFEFLHANTNQNQIKLRHGDIEQTLKNASFNRLTSLKLYFITDEPFDTRQICLLQNLPVLESLYVEIAHKSTASILKNLWKVTKSSSLKEIIFFWPAAYKPFLIKMHRVSINDAFDKKSFDIKAHIQKRKKTVKQSLLEQSLLEQSEVGKIRGKRNDDVEEKFSHPNDRTSIFEDDLEILHLRNELDYLESLVIFFRIEDILDSLNCKIKFKSKKKYEKQYIDKVMREIRKFKEPKKNCEDVIAFVNGKLAQLRLEEESQLNLMKQQILISLQSAINDELDAMKCNLQQESKSKVKGNCYIPFKPFQFLRKLFFDKKKSINKRKSE